jgi:hypothetical protein
LEQQPTSGGPGSNRHYGRQLLPLANVHAGLANWDVEFAAARGITMSPECKRAAIGVKHGVQKRFDLVGE